MFLQNVNFLQNLPKAEATSSISSGVLHKSVCVGTDFCFAALKCTYISTQARWPKRNKDRVCRLSFRGSRCVSKVYWTDRKAGRIQRLTLMCRNGTKEVRSRTNVTVATRPEKRRSWDGD